jgi:hypothetical protein
MQYTAAIEIPYFDAAKAAWVDISPVDTIDARSARSARFARFARSARSARSGGSSACLVARAPARAAWGQRQQAFHWSWARLCCSSSCPWIRSNCWVSGQNGSKCQNFKTHHSWKKTMTQHPPQSPHYFFYEGCSLEICGCQKKINARPKL